MSKRYSVEEIKRKVIDVLKDIDTGLSGVEISEKLGINRITVAKYLDVLEAIGLIKKKKAGSVNVWYLAEGVTEFELPIDLLDVQQLYMKSLFDHSEDEARRVIINVLHSDINPVRILSEVLAPTMNTAEELYNRGRMTNTERTYLSNLINESIDLVKFDAKRSGVKGNADAVFLTAQGETNSVQSKMAAVTFYIHGWNSYFLGSVGAETDLFFDIDLMKFIDNISDVQRGLLIIGISVMNREHVPGTGELLKSIRSKISKNMFAFAHGEAFEGEEDATNMGADHYAGDLRSAIEWADDLYNKVKW